MTRTITYKTKDSEGTLKVEEKQFTSKYKSAILLDAKNYVHELESKGHTVYSYC